MNKAVCDDMFDMMEAIREQIIFMEGRIDQLTSRGGFDPGIWEALMEMSDSLKQIKFCVDTATSILGNYAYKRFTEPELGFA